MKVRRLHFDDILKLNWKPEPHTVTLNKDKPNGEWWGLEDQGRIVCVCCVFDRPYDKCFTRVFTPVQLRGHGYCTTLLYDLSHRVYKNNRLVAHCLEQSVGSFSRAGFSLQDAKKYKYSILYTMKKEAENGKTTD